MLLGYRNPRGTKEFVHVGSSSTYFPLVAQGNGKEHDHDATIRSGTWRADPKQMGGGELYGTRWTLFFKPTRFAEPARWDFEERDLFVAQTKHFVDCILDGVPCVSPYEQGIAALKLILEAYESARKA